LTEEIRILRKELEELSNQKNTLLTANIKLKENMSRKSESNLLEADAIKKQVKHLNEEKAELYLENESLKRELKLVQLEHNRNKLGRLNLK
jgi:hypothetical protein